MSTETQNGSSRFDFDLNWLKDRFRLIALASVIVCGVGGIAEAIVHVDEAVATLKHFLGYDCTRIATAAPPAKGVTPPSTDKTPSQESPPKPSSLPHKAELAFGNLIHQPPLCTEAATVDKLTVGKIDATAFDGSKTIANVIEVGEINGQTAVKLAAAPGGYVAIRGPVDGQTNLTIDAEGATVEFFDVVNGQSQLTIHAKRVIFRKKIDGDFANINGQRIRTTVTIFLTAPGYVSYPELCALLQCTKSNDTDPDPVVDGPEATWNGQRILVWKLPRPQQIAAK